MCHRKSGGKALAERQAKMNDKTQQCGAEDLAQDIKNNAVEAATELEAILGETKPEDYRGDDWECVREAIKEARANLDAIEDALNEKQNEADEYDPETDENRYATWWE